MKKNLILSAIVLFMFSLVSCKKETDLQNDDIIKSDNLNGNENSNRTFQLCNLNGLCYPVTWPAVGATTTTTSSTGAVVDTVVHPEEPGFSWSSLDTSMTLETELSLDMPPIGNQGNQGSCTSWACTYAAASFIKHKTNTSWSYFNYENTGFDYSHLLSPAYTYNQITNNCGGTSLHATLSMLKNQGACSLYQFPYNQNNCITQPNSSQTTAALSNKINGFKKVNNNAYIRWAIHYGYPVVFVAQLDAKFGKQSTSDGKKIWRSNTSELKGLHAMCVIGFSNIRRAYLVQNSWGTGWGNNGRIWIDYTKFNQALVNNEAYLVR